jgi:hypothetical protein
LAYPTQPVGFRPDATASPNKPKEDVELLAHLEQHQLVPTLARVDEPRLDHHPTFYHFVDIWLDKVKSVLHYVAMTTSEYTAQPREVISVCPVCEGDLRVTRLQCATCGTAIEGHFSVGRFSRLDREQMALLESFLRSRGNLRELERELGISYPTVRNRVEALLRALELADGTAPPADEPVAADPGRRRQILERLARREITAEQAAAEMAAAGETAAEEQVQ